VSIYSNDNKAENITENMCPINNSLNIYYIDGYTVKGMEDARCSASLPLEQ